MCGNKGVADTGQAHSALAHSALRVLRRAVNGTAAFVVLSLLLYTYARDG